MNSQRNGSRKQADNGPSLKDEKGVIRWRKLSYICGHRPAKWHEYKGDRRQYCRICGLSETSLTAGTLFKKKDKGDRPLNPRRAG